MPQSQIQSAASARIAVVDDDASFLRSLGRLLRSGGYAVDMFSSGDAFLKSLASGRPACVVLDVQMPQMSGLEVQDRLAAMEVALPIIFITAHDTPQFHERSQQSSTAGWLLKPFCGHALLQTIAKVLSPRP